MSVVGSRRTDSDRWLVSPETTNLETLLDGIGYTADCPVVAVLTRGNSLDEMPRIYASAGQITQGVGEALVSHPAIASGWLAGTPTLLDADAAQVGQMVLIGVLPIVDQDETMGVLALLRDGYGEPLTGHDLRVLEWFVSQIAVALAGTETIRGPGDVHGPKLETRDRLARIQSAMRRVLETSDTQENLHAIAETIVALGWGRVIVAVFNDEGEIGQVITHGNPSGVLSQSMEEILPSSIWEQYRRGELDELRVSGFYYLPEIGGNADAWGEGDLLFTVLRVGQGSPVGVIRVEAPANGRRPTMRSLQALDILAGQAAYLIENARLLSDAASTADLLSDQVEELSMINRADRELSAHLNVERVMALTMDWALRRTRANAGALALMTNDRRGLVPLTSIGLSQSQLVTYDESNPIPLGHGVLGRVAQTGHGERVCEEDGREIDCFLPDLCTELVLPLAMRGEVLGVIALFSRDPDAFGDDSRGFMERLARRSAVALDNARLFRQSEQLADDMSVLYTASRTITSTLDRDEVLQRIAQSMAVALECSSAIISDYAEDACQAQVLTVYKVGTARDAVEMLPAPGDYLELGQYPVIRRAIQGHRPVTMRLSALTEDEPEYGFLKSNHLLAVVVVPLVAQDEIVGLVFIIEGRRDRIFSASKVFKVQTLASQASVAIRQSLLYNEILELEKIKSEMIRMASHDLRNPLNNIMGYIELVGMSAESNPDDEINDYVDSLRRSAKTMRSLIDDLLTLERVESEREIDWQEFDLGALALEVIQVEESSARLKQQELTYDRETGLPQVFGSVTQLRQAISNLVGNAIKYTPEAGHISVYYAHRDGRLQFWVEDDGYGISPERQARLFERFYRAREPGTDSIPGTGLGLSLVRTVVERHGGEVWFRSEPGVGSTFGFWLPKSTRSVDR